MIQRDKDGFIFDNSSKDQMDSACRVGLMALAHSDIDQILIPKFEIVSGTLVRSPQEAPSNNPRNFTRDQLTTWAAGAWRANEYLCVERVYYAHKKRLFFCQNIDRDVVNVSRKQPFPHYYIEWETGKPKFSWFDYRDPLSPSDVMHLKICANMPVEPLLKSVGEFWLKREIDSYAKTENEVNQLLAKVVPAGMTKYFVEKVPDYKRRLKNYWGLWRRQNEIADALIEMIEKELYADPSGKQKPLS